MAGQGPNMDQFEAYFQRADIDRDDRISGTEAVINFFQGSNLPKQVLAQILYKSRSDNRLNEITEKQKREISLKIRCCIKAESLAKKVEEKNKQVGDVASKLTIELATFCDIQDKKLELYQAIVKLEEGDADGIQDRANQIRSDIEELVKILE
ncbi:Calcium-binding EF hand family protein [Forsythia ovata]|uniref:Calcium-binding EF hand family protein n=1 Tax=Forsythia ovata TaxID=205694 RepID=A0ABD1UB86_9LAMI